MISTVCRVLIVVVLFVCAAACSGQAQENKAEGAKPSATPGKNFTPADVAKLKWIEGTWRGMDGDKPFFERYRVEESALVVEGFEDESLAKVTDTGRFELKEGEFGKTEGDRRSAASEITDNYIQFVPAVGSKGNNFRFEKQSDGTWRAVLEWPATAEKPARQKVYVMEPWPKK